MPTMPADHATAEVAERLDNVVDRPEALQGQFERILAELERREKVPPEWAVALAEEDLGKDAPWPAIAERAWKHVAEEDGDDA